MLFEWLSHCQIGEKGGADLAKVWQIPVDVAAGMYTEEAQTVVWRYANLSHDPVEQRCHNGRVDPEFAGRCKLYGVMKCCRAGT